MTIFSPNYNLLCLFCFQLYGKEYGSDDEEFQRRGIWEMHRSYVEEHNRNADVYGFTTGMNEYADLVSDLGFG